MAILAQVCRAFCTPALDVLWYCLEDVVPVLRTLTPFRRAKGAEKYVCIQLPLGSP